jgi:hypothetical protein
MPLGVYEARKRLVAASEGEAGLRRAWSGAKARAWPPARYSVEFDSELIVEGSRDPEHDFARALLARGLTAKVIMLDANTGKPRTIIDIEKAAKLTVSEESRDGLRCRKYRESPDSDSQAAKDDIVLPHHTPRGKRGCMSHSRT